MNRPNKIQVLLLVVQLVQIIAIAYVFQNYAKDHHSHRWEYAGKGHNHRTKYAANGHNHQGEYAEDGHDHNTIFGKKYAEKGHHHWQFHSH